jgi:error-prone DNA polymerase
MRAAMRYGVASPAALVTRAAELGMPALALTDRDGLYGAVKHAVACQAAGLRRVRRSRTRHAPSGTQVLAAPVAGRQAPDGGRREPVALF